VWSLNCTCIRTYLAVREVRVVDRRRLGVFASLVHFAEMLVDQSSTYPQTIIFIQKNRQEQETKKKRRRRRKQKRKRRRKKKKKKKKTTTTTTTTTTKQQKQQKQQKNKNKNKKNINNNNNIKKTYSDKWNKKYAKWKKGIQQFSGAAGRRWRSWVEKVVSTNIPQQLTIKQ